MKFSRSSVVLVSLVMILTLILSACGDNASASDLQKDYNGKIPLVIQGGGKSPEENIKEKIAKENKDYAPLLSATGTELNSQTVLYKDGIQIEKYIVTAFDAGKSTIKGGSAFEGQGILMSLSYYTFSVQDLSVYVFLSQDGNLVPIFMKKGFAPFVPNVGLKSELEKFIKAEFPKAKELKDFKFYFGNSI